MPAIRTRGILGCYFLIGLGYARPVTEGSDEQRETPSEDQGERPAADPWIPLPTQPKWRRLRRNARAEAQDPPVGPEVAGIGPVDGD